MHAEPQVTRRPGENRAALAIALCLIAAILVGLGLFLAAMWQRTLSSLDGPEAEAPAMPRSSPTTGRPPDEGPQPTPAEPKPSRPVEAAAANSERPQGQRLSDLKPIEVVSVNLGEGELRRSASLGGQTRRDCLWAQPAAGQETSQITYSLAGGYSRVRGLAFVHESDADGQPREPSAVFRIYGDGNLLWESAALKTGGAAQPIDVALTGVTVVALTADSPAAAACAWGEMLLVK